MCSKQRQRFCWVDNALCSAWRVNGFGGRMTRGVSPDVARLQTAKISDFRKPRQTKEGNHKGLSLHARQGLWAIPTCKQVAKNPKSWPSAIINNANGFVEWITRYVPPDVTQIVLTVLVGGWRAAFHLTWLDFKRPKILIFESSDIKKGNHKELALHARDGLWAILRASLVQKTRKVDRVLSKNAPTVLLDG